jgi:hypothetical protein
MPCRARWPGSRVRGAESDCLCEECGDGELAADATSPVVHQTCTAMSRERPEAALRSYGHFSWRRTNDQHVHGTFLKPRSSVLHDRSVTGLLLSSKRTWCDLSLASFQLSSPVTGGTEAANPKSVHIQRSKSPFTPFELSDLITTTRPARP